MAKEYYWRTHNHQIRRPDLFGVMLPGGAVIPSELCTIVAGQIFKKKTPSHLMSEVHRFTSKQPAHRLEDIKNGVRGSVSSLCRISLAVHILTHANEHASS